MQPLLVAIAGGTGAGKTTLANALAEREPDRYAVVRLDDYFKRREDMVPVDGIINWERPDAIRYDQLRSDLEQLRSGSSVTVTTRIWRYDAQHQKVHEENFSYTIESKPVIVVEGFLVLSDSELRTMFDLAIYLDIPIEASLERRLKADNKYNAEEYLRDVLVPAHREFVEPTKLHADVLIPVVGKSAEEVYQAARAKIEERLAA